MAPVGGAAAAAAATKPLVAMVWVWGSRAAGNNNNDTGRSPAALWDNKLRGRDSCGVGGLSPLSHRFRSVPTSARRKDQIDEAEEGKIAKYEKAK